MNAEAQSQQAAPQKRSFISEAAITALLIYAWWQTRPFFQGLDLTWISHCIAMVAGIFGLETLCRILLFLSYVCDWIAASIPSGKDGTSSFASTKDIASALSKVNRGPFWGKAITSGKAIFADYVSNAMTIGPAGSGKLIFVVTNMILSILHSKIIIDFKGEISACLIRTLRAMGQKVYLMNAFQILPDVIGVGESLNPLDVLTSNLSRPGGIKDFYSDAFELASKLYPEPESGKSDNTYWRDGGRDLIADLSILECLVEGDEASLAKVSHTLQNRKDLELNLRWVVGVDTNGQPLDGGPMPIEQSDWVRYHNAEDVTEFCKLFRARMANHLALMCSTDSRTFDSFLSGAQKSMALFGLPRIAQAIKKSTFDPNEMKNGDVPSNFIFVCDPSKPEANERLLTITLWRLLTMQKRHPNKDKPVYHIFDECTNYLIPDLGELLTWGRGFGVRMHLIFQDINAFEKKYSKPTLETLLSETEIKQFLPGQRSPRTLELISKTLGNMSLIASSYINNGVEKGMRWNTNEAGRPVSTPDEIRRSPHGILIIGASKPIEFEPVSYAEIDPWRDMVDPNPYHGNKRFKKKVKLRV